MTPCAVRTLLTAATMADDETFFARARSRGWGMQMREFLERAGRRLRAWNANVHLRRAHAQDGGGRSDGRSTSARVDLAGDIQRSSVGKRSRQQSSSHCVIGECRSQWSPLGDRREKTEAVVGPRTSRYRRARVLDAGSSSAFLEAKMRVGWKYAAGPRVVTRSPNRWRTRVQCLGR